MYDGYVRTTNLIYCFLEIAINNKILIDEIGYLEDILLSGDENEATNGDNVIYDVLLGALE